MAPQIPFSNSFRRQHPILVEVADLEHEGLDYAERTLHYAGQLIRIYSGHKAFRKYRWFAGAAKNAAGNMRGMVLSRRWKTVFQFGKTLGGAAETIGDFTGWASLAIETANSIQRIKDVAVSNEGNVDKTVHLLCIAESIGMKVLTSAVKPAAHDLAKAIDYTAGVFNTPARYVVKAHQWDAKIKAYMDTITDDQHIEHFIRINVL